MQKKKQVKTAKGRKVSSTHWLYRHINDPFVTMAKEQNYRSRAAFKLIEINDKFKIIPKSGILIDLGCAPGSWLQVLSRLSNLQTIGLDLKEINCQDIPNVTTITGDFTEDTTLNLLREKVEGRDIKLVLSDMAPNSSGDKTTDHIRIAYLAQLVLDFIEDNCKAGGNSVIKIIEGNMSKEIDSRAKKLFSKVHWYKPKASYSDSAEKYLVMVNKLI
jgi:23S rRNA (uridine2552-2'-O)-methyltransferase